MSEEDDIPLIQSMEQFQHRIKEWVVLDNQINKYNTKLRDLRKLRTKISNRAVNFMETSEQEGLVINIADGKLKYFETKTRGQPNITFLRNCLMEYFNDNNEEVNKLVKFIQERLPIKEDKGLKRYFVKKNESS